MKNRKLITRWCTYALVAMSVAFAVIGFSTAGKSMWQILALTATLGPFTWMLSECLETYLEHRKHNSWRQHTTILLGSFFLGIEIYLVHFGAGWLMDDLHMVILYLAAAGFSLITLLAKATFGHEYPEEPGLEPGLADKLEAIGGSSTNDEIVDRSLIAA